jgi:glycosyltransferase involved in cell wall biosynthesis
MRQLKREIKRKLKGVVRRQADRFLPTKQTREYRKWIADRLAFRQRFYQEPLQPGLLSLLTAVWDGSPLVYLKQLAESLSAQNRAGACEWVIVDNGCSKPSIREFLAQLSDREWVKVRRTEENVGIVGGLRFALEYASGRYVCPIDADDWIYPDALRAVIWGLRNAGFPPLLFTDEDKIIDRQHYQPYMKPAWDPVLLLNSAYIAHLGVVDREKAIAVGAYTDSRAEASPDWDLFIRFFMAGYSAAHLPEIVYSWRVHAESTADDAASKAYVAKSQQAVLQRFLDQAPGGMDLRIRNSPLLPGAPHWHFVREQPIDKQFRTFLLSHDGAREVAAKGVRMPATETLAGIMDLLAPAAAADAFVAFIGEDVEIEHHGWTAEVLAISEVHRDVVMVGGRIRNRKGLITTAGQYFGVCGVCGCPYRGLRAEDPGYFAQIWKQRSVSAVATQFAVVKARFLFEIAPEIPPMTSLPFLGAWIGARAQRRNRRVAYSPFLTGISDMDWEAIPVASEQELFVRENGDLLPDTRFYSPALSVTSGFALGNVDYAPQIRTANS